MTTKKPIFQVQVQHSGGGGNWSELKGTWGVVDPSPIADSFECVGNVELLDKFDTDEAMHQFVRTLKSCTISLEGAFLADVEDSQDEDDTLSVPTDARTPDSFHIQESLWVRMYLSNGQQEYDTERWTTPTGAQGRIRQLMFAREDVASCEIVTLWRREKLLENPPGGQA